jgi:hypothetical protein
MRTESEMAEMAGNPIFMKTLAVATVGHLAAVIAHKLYGIAQEPKPRAKGFFERIFPWNWSETYLACEPRMEWRVKRRVHDSQKTVIVATLSVLTPTYTRLYPIKVLDSQR